jgi:hypothetical protein
MDLRNPLMASCIAAVLACATAQAQAQAPAPPQTLIPAPAHVGSGSADVPPQGAAPAAGEELPASAQWVDQQVATYRQQVEARVARGDMNPDEAERLIGWHRWQLEQQAAGRAPAPQIVARQNAEYSARRNIVVAPASGPYYAPYYRPYGVPYYGSPYTVGPAYGPYYGPGYGTFVPGISVCAGGSGHHFGASVCF